MKAKPSLQVRWHSAIAEIPQSDWDRLAAVQQTSLLEWRWLHEMEASGSIAPQHGWHPQHLTVWHAQTLVGAAPLYIKSHSDGEFVFDQWWARLAAKADISYYPKMVGMSPVTPSVGYRFLTDSDMAADPIQEIMFTAIDSACTRMGLSGCHLLFVDPLWRATLASQRFVPWRHQSFLWRNKGYATFEDYLQAFKSSQRRNIRRERQQMRKMGISFRTLQGPQLTPELARIMYRYYVNTNAQYGPWGCRYLNSEFFTQLFERYHHRLIVIAAYPPSGGERPVALSMLLHKRGHLIGRYWGCGLPIKDLHFNMCFYEPIQWAIDNHIQTFDPGAGSPHKVQRGFESVENFSLHRFYNPHLKFLFQHFIDDINKAEQENIDALNAMLPFAEHANPIHRG
jgi:uncharacterized protein